MAKEKKTLEEKMEEAIVKDGPYEVPGNWIWTKFGNIVSINPKKVDVKHLDDNIECSFIPMNIVDNELGIIHETEIKRLEEVKKGYTNFIQGDIIFAKITPCMENKKSAIVPKLMNDLGYGSTEFHVFRVDSRYVYNKYIFYFVRSHEFLSEATSAMTGAVGQQRVPKSFIEEYKVPFPPLNEQQRIVDKIESLFEKLDRAKELIEEAREGFEKRKQWIIESALKGEFLTDISLKQVELGSILCFKNGISKRTGKEGIMTKVLRLADIDEDTIYSEDSREMLLTEKEIENYKLENGDLVLIRVNGTRKNVGRAIQYFGQEMCAYCDHLIRIDSEKFNKDYIKFLINSDEVRKQLSELIVSSAGQNTISQSSLSVIKATIVEDLNTQLEIIEVINKFVNKEKKLEELTQLEEQIELIKKSILAKAFRGQLGTNCGEDESALELLKEILLNS